MCLHYRRFGGISTPVFDKIGELNWFIKILNKDFSEEKIKPLKELMEKTNKVRIIGPNTDLSFSIKGLPAIPCVGTANIPDGDVWCMFYEKHLFLFCDYSIVLITDIRRVAKPCVCIVIYYGVSYCVGDESVCAVWTIPYACLSYVSYSCSVRHSDIKK